MENNAPGKTKMKVTGILYIIGAALTILAGLIVVLGGGLLLAADDGTGVGTVFGAVAGAAGIITILSAVLGLVVGILGVKNCDKPEKCGVNFVLGVIMIVFSVLNIAGTMMKGTESVSTTLIGGVIGLIIPVIYTWGAKQNKDAA